MIIKPFGEPLFIYVYLIGPNIKHDFDYKVDTILFFNDKEKLLNMINDLIIYTDDYIQFLNKINEIKDKIKNDNEFKMHISVNMCFEEEFELNYPSIVFKYNRCDAVNVIGDMIGTEFEFETDMDRSAGCLYVDADAYVYGFENCIKAIKILDGLHILSETKKFDFKFVLEE